MRFVAFIAEPSTYSPVLMMTMSIGGEVHERDNRMPSFLNTVRSIRLLGLAALMAAFATVSLPATEVMADPVVDQQCRQDYKRLCGMHPPRSAETRRCMEVRRKALSRGCVNALASAGMIPKKYLKDTRRR